MAAKKRRGQQPQIKGFRPGKAPAHLKKQHAKAQLGSRASWAQKAAVDAVAGRSPAEVRAMVKKWSTAATVGALLLGVAGVFVYGYSVPGGVAVHVASALLLFLGYRVRKSGEGLVEMADSM
jgi:hypothetical protein